MNGTQYTDRSSRKTGQLLKKKKLCTHFQQDQTTAKLLHRGQYWEPKPVTEGLTTKGL